MVLAASAAVGEDGPMSLLRRVVRPMLAAGRDGIPAMRAIAESLAAAAHDTSSRSAT